MFIFFDSSTLSHFKHLVRCFVDNPQHDDNTLTHVGLVDQINYLQKNIHLPNRYIW